MDSSLKFFRSYKTVLAWIGYTRPDALCAINKVLQLTVNTFNEDKIKYFNKTMKCLKETSKLCMNYNSLKKSSLYLNVCSNASFAGNDDLSSQLGFIILLRDNPNNAHIMDYPSRESKPVLTLSWAWNYMSLLMDLTGHL